MRRKDREVTDTAEIREILDRAEVLRLALNDGVYPYVVPVNFGFRMDGDRLTLFFHGAKEGAKHDVIRRDPHVTFETDGGHMLLRPSGDEACAASYAYESVIGRGIVEPAAEAEKAELLTALLAHYGIRAGAFRPEQLAAVAVYKITAESYTAKRRLRG